ncbi:MAG: response regulator transcription factor [Bdellovibrionaceae bacterium]|nr:response regulator transcription factor [Pseudobdellovibrionaceae bacterium]
MIEILLVEDDPGIGRGLSIHLQTEGYQVYWAKNLEEAKTLLPVNRIELVLLDLGLPDGSGLDFLTRIRGEAFKKPVIILTAQTEEDKVVEGFERGATDYVKKPFGTRELVARIKAALREPLLREESFRYGELVMKTKSRAVEYKGQAFDLNRKEYEILLYLVQRAEQAVTRADLVQAIDKDAEIFDRTVDSHVSHIRTKLRKAGIEDIQIAPIYGIGYRLEKT